MRRMSRPRILTISYTSARRVRVELSRSWRRPIDPCGARPMPGSYSARYSERGPRFHLAVSAGLVAAGLACAPAVAQTTDNSYRIEEPGVTHSSRLVDYIKEFATAPLRWRGRER